MYILCVCACVHFINSDGCCGLITPPGVSVFIRNYNKQRSHYYVCYISMFLANVTLHIHVLTQNTRRKHSHRRALTFTVSSCLIGGWSEALPGNFPLEMEIVILYQSVPKNKFALQGWQLNGGAVVRVFDSWQKGPRFDPGVDHRCLSVLSFLQVHWFSSTVQRRPDKVNWLL